MELAVGIFIYFLIVLISAIVISYHKIKLRSALIVSLIIGQISINCLIPASNLNLITGTTIKFDSFSAIYILIQLLTPIIVAIYSMYIGLHDLKIPI
jgi:hypothetical protein